MVKLDAGWSDLGAWDAVWQIGKADANGNVATGDVLLNDVHDSLIHSSSRLVSAVGVQDLIVVETADAVLVANRSKSQNVKDIVAQLDQKRREEKNLHRKVFRPWGWYDSVDEGEHFKVKRIQVKPGASLSLQMHHHRAEHWIVVKGVAEIHNGDQIFAAYKKYFYSYFKNENLIKEAIERTYKIAHEQIEKVDPSSKPKLPIYSGKENSSNS
jgi:mannose-1-phosphate guanylyltransferase/mannose-6-phosphate isomerase